MATLEGKKIKDTYQSIIKVDDNGNVSSSLKTITDGQGNSTGIQLNTSGDLSASGIISAAQVNVSGNLAVDTNTLYVDAANNRVGIGTSSPAAAMHIIGADENQLRLGTAETEWYQIGRDTTGGLLHFYGSQSGYTGYVFGGVNGERMRIDSSGVVQVINQTPTIQLYNTDTSLSANQVIGDIDFYQSDPSGGGVGVVSKIRSINSSSFQGEAGLAFHTGTTSGLTERMRIDSSGNVNQAGTLTIKNSITDSYGLKLWQDTGDTSKIFNHYNGPLVFGTLNTERMRIDSSGSIHIGRTGGSLSTAGYSFVKSGNTAYAEFVHSNTGDGSANLYVSRANNGTAILFYRGDLSSTVGSISVTTTATAYNTSSDYRLKENVVEMTGALDRVDALKPSRFNFIADPEKTVDGFLAHEVQAIVPEAVTGEKDAVDEEGNPIYQGIDQSKIVPLLVGAIKELSAKVAALESQLNA